MRNITLQITLKVNDDEISLDQVFSWVMYFIDIIAGKDILTLTMRNISPPKELEVTQKKLRKALKALEDVAFKTISAEYTEQDQALDEACAQARNALEEEA